MNPIDAVLQRLEGAKRVNGGYVARCPAHDDRDPSLSLSEGEGGRVLLHCHAGCETGDIVKALGLETHDLFPDDPKRGGRIVAEYDYTDEEGAQLFQVVRFAPKDFRQRRLVAGGWEWNLGDTRRVLYRLPRVIDEAKRGGFVHVAEGEKDVEALEAAGAVATCNPGGAGKWRPEYSDSLLGARVIVVADKDEPGRKHAEQVATSLTDKALSVTIAEAKEGKDAADHLEAGHGLEDFQPVTTKTDMAATPEGPFVNWAAFWQRDQSQAEWVFDPVLARGRGHALYAIHKAGKSLLMLHIAAKLATGQDRIVVIYLDYEMGEDDLQDRLQDMGYGPEDDLSRLKYALLPTLPPLDTEAGAKALTELLDGAQTEWPDYHLVVIVDTISRAIEGEENSSDTFRAFYSHSGIELKRRGITWARLDHSGKNPTKGPRGSSGKGDDVDVVWRLDKTQNGVCLTRDLARMHWIPEKVIFCMTEDPLSFTRLAGDWPAGTRETAEALERLGVAANASIRIASSRLKEADQGRRTTVVSAAQRWRKEHEGQPA